MPEKLFFFQSNSLDIFWNLAKEEQLLQELKPDQALLFVYRNSPSVVIGKHQNPWSEAWTTKLLTSDVKLVRRNSGGGAVYHDEGNLNFSFIESREYYSVSRHFGIVLETLQRLGLTAQRNDRNDLVMEGFKFSGSAFSFRKNTACHHGTLLISSDLENMSQYLKKNSPLIESKAIPSVPSSVHNLSRWKKGLTVDEVIDALFKVFKDQASVDVLFEKVEKLDALSPALLGAAFEEQILKGSSWEWNFGRTPDFSLTCDVGTNHLKISVLEGRVGSILMEGKGVFSEMTGQRFDPVILRKNILNLPESCRPLFGYVLEVLIKDVFGKTEF